MFAWDAIRAAIEIGYLRVQRVFGSCLVETGIRQRLVTRGQIININMIYLFTYVPTYVEFLEQQSQLLFSIIDLSIYSILTDYLISVHDSVDISARVLIKISDTCKVSILSYISENNSWRIFKVSSFERFYNCRSLNSRILMHGVALLFTSGAHN